VPLPRLARNWVTSPITGFSPVFPEFAGYRKSLETERVRKEQKMNTKSDLEERNRPATAGSEYFETVIIGGGQAGLSVGYHLKKQGRPFVILDANERIGDAWRKRWDSLRLFTPARYDGL
jgi:NAD(P)-binding Rossmann-like domain